MHLSVDRVSKQLQQPRFSLCATFQHVCHEAVIWQAYDIRAMFYTNLIVEQAATEQSITERMSLTR